MTLSSYFLAVDVGTSRTAASTARLRADGMLVTNAFGLGRSSDSAPSAIFVSDDDLLFGEAAERRGLAQPERLIREFKRRIGDDVPIVAAGHRFAPEYLYARMVGWVAENVAAREGHQPAAISVTIPVTWGGYRAGLIAAAIAREVSAEIELITEPEAAARHYETTTPLDAGGTLAVYDLGGGTFDAVVLRKEDDGAVRIVGTPTGLGDFGGADFDDAVLRHTIAAAGLTAADLAADSGARVALASLRRECVEAKEALSFDSEAVIPVLIGQASTTVRLTRSEFEDMIDSGVHRTIDVLATALESAGVETADLQAILLTGGSSRIPRISQLLSEHFDRPLAIDADPKAIVALGAARALASRSIGESDTDETDGTGVAASAVAELDPLDETFGAAGVGGEREAVARRKWFGRLPVTAALATGALVLTCGVVIATATELDRGALAAQPAEKSLTDWLQVTLMNSSTPIGAGTAVATSPVTSVPPTSSTPTPEPAPRYTNPRRQVAERVPEAPRSIAAPVAATPLLTPAAVAAAQPAAPQQADAPPAAVADPPAPASTGSSAETPASADTSQPAETSEPTESPTPTEPPAPTTSPTETTPPADQGNSDETSTPENSSSSTEQTPVETTEPLPATPTEEPSPEPTPDPSPSSGEPS